jgi:hypothetical protein
LISVCYEKSMKKLQELPTKSENSLSPLSGSINLL